MAYLNCFTGAKRTWWKQGRARALLKQAEDLVDKVKEIKQKRSEQRSHPKAIFDLTWGVRKGAFFILRRECVATRTISFFWRKITHAVVQQFTSPFSSRPHRAPARCPLDELLEKLAKTALRRSVDGTPGYEIAAERHHDQLRSSGDPYLTHLLKSLTFSRHASRCHHLTPRFFTMPSKTRSIRFHALKNASVSKSRAWWKASPKSPAQHHGSEAARLKAFAKCFWPWSMMFALFW